MHSNDEHYDPDVLNRYITILKMIRSDIASTVAGTNTEKWMDGEAECVKVMVSIDNSIENAIDHLEEHVRIATEEDSTEVEDRANGGYA